MSALMWFVHALAVALAAAAVLTGEITATHMLALGVICVLAPGILAFLGGASK